MQNLSADEAKKSGQQHTPGPWHFNEDLSHHLTRLVYAADGHLVADAGRIHKRSIEEMTANARLIAVAPELLQALEHATQELEGWYDLAKNGLRTSKGKREVVVSIGQFGRLTTMRKIIDRAKFIS